MTPPPVNPYGNCTEYCYGMIPDPWWWVDPLYHLLLGMLPLLVVLFAIALVLCFIWSDYCEEQQ
jgi:hypothetical protein